jgi:hypothetical protein
VFRGEAEYFPASVVGVQRFELAKRAADPDVRVVPAQ